MSQFKRIKDFMRPLEDNSPKQSARFISFEGERYSLTMEITSYRATETAPPRKSYILSVHTKGRQSKEMENSGFLPYISVLHDEVGDNYLPVDLRIETTSYGGLSIGIYSQMLDAQQLALSDAKEIRNEFIDALKDGRHLPAFEWSPDPAEGGESHA